MADIIIPGTTPTITLELDADVSGATAARLTIRYGRLTVMERELPDLQIDGSTVTAVLTEADTLALPDCAHLGVQLRLELGGQVLSTDILPLGTAATLSRKELAADE